MIYPTVFPLATENYDDIIEEFKSNAFITYLLNNDWDISTYEGKGDPEDIAWLQLLEGFKLTDTRLTWFFYPTEQYWLSKIDKLRTRLKQNNNVDVKIEDMGAVFIVLVPGAHLQEHLDRGRYSGTSLVIPILNSGIFSYNKNEKNFLIDKPTFASNTVWHNYRNNTKKLHIFMTVAMPIDISELKEYNLKNADEL
jgi:hypothetical protein